MFSRSLRPSKNKARRGGIMVIVAGGLTALIGFGALVCDVGLALAQRTKMQMAADASALAAVTHLKKSESVTKLEGITVAKLNGYNIKGTDIFIDKKAEEVTVAWKEPTGFVLGPVLNRFGVKVGVSATAGLVSIQEKVRVMPFMVTDEFLVGNKGPLVTIKYKAGDGHKGNYGPVAIDGTGASVYERSIVEGAETPLRTGMFVDTETGNMRGPTDQGVDALIAGDDTPYEEVLTRPNKRLVTVLIVSEQDFNNLNGRKPILIRGFARFYLMGSQNGEVKGRFIDTFFGHNAPPPNETRPKLVR